MDYTSAPGYVIDSQGRRQYADRNVANGVPGTSLLAADRNAVANTIIAVFKAFGIVPDAADDTLLVKAINAAVEVETVRATTIESNLQSSKQDKLSFTPVAQGKGPGQGSNVLSLGWDSSGLQHLRYSVDGADQGRLPNYADLQAQNATPYVAHTISAPPAGGSIVNTCKLSGVGVGVVLVIASANIAGNAGQPDACSLAINVDGTQYVSDKTRTAMSLSWAGTLANGDHTITTTYTAPAGSDTFFNVGVGMSMIFLPFS